MNFKIKLNINILFFLLYILFIITNDYLCFIFKTNMRVIFYICSFIVCLIVFLLIKKHLVIEKNKINKYDVIMLIIIAMSFISRITIPDSSFDTLNYHLYLQERVFSNNVLVNFFPARWINTFSLPLADRMHFFFRLILGYRLGIILNLFIMIIIYYQVKEILKKFIKNDLYISLISSIVIITEQLLTNMITYYVDLFSIPLFLEIIIIILNNKKVNNLTNFIVLFMAGILISLKISNAFFVILLAIIYIIKFHKYFNYKTYLLGIPLVLFPIGIYLLNNYIQTGNPVFPFYNSIFKSSYLSNDNWMETFYGPKRMLERLLWPIVVFFNPRRAHDVDIYYGRISFGYLISIITTLYGIYKYIFKHEKLTEFNYITILYILFALIWSNFMMGYIRYALVLEIISGIIIAISVYKFFNSKNKLLFFVSLFGIYSFIYTTFFTMGDILNGSTELSWRNSYAKDDQNYLDNEKNLFTNHINYDKYIKEVDCFGIVDYNAGYAAMLSKNKRIINLNEGYATEYGKKEFENILNTCNNIYTISTDITLERTELYLEKSGFKRIGENIEFKADFINSNNNVVIFEIEEMKE